MLIWCPRGAESVLLAASSAMPASILLPSIITLANAKGGQPRIIPYYLSCVAHFPRETNFPCLMHVLTAHAPLLALYFITALQPSLTACLESSPGKQSRTADWTSREVMVSRFPMRPRRFASCAMRSNVSPTHDSMTCMACLEMRSLGCTCLRTLNTH